MGEAAYTVMQEMAAQIITKGDRAEARNALTHCIKFGQDCQAAIAMLASHLGIRVASGATVPLMGTLNLNDTRDHVVTEDER